MHILPQIQRAGAHAVTWRIGQPNAMSFTSLDHLLERAVPTVAPALVCRVEQGGRLLFERSLGWINPMLKTRPVTPDTIFDLASLTKLFTTTACLRMVDAGLLNLDSPIGEILPEMRGTRRIGPIKNPLTKLPEPPLAAWRDLTTPIDLRGMTVRRLLTHSSGLPAWQDLSAECGDVPERPSTFHRAELLRRRRAALQAIARYDLAYPPGASYSYSDLGFILLGEALTTRAGDPLLADTLQSWLLTPMGLGAHYHPTCLEMDDVAPTEFCPWRKRRLHGEVHDENAASIGGISGHAGLFGRVADLARLGNLYLEHGQSLLAPATAAAAIAQQLATLEAEQPLTPPRRDDEGIRRGLGWMLNSGPAPSCSTAFSPRSFGHTGYTGGSLWCDPDRELVVVLLTNRVYNGRQAEPITTLRPAVHHAVVEALNAA